MKSANDAIVLTELIDSTPQQIWKAWTDADTVLKWFGSDPNGKGIHAALDVHTGGHYTVTFADSSGTEHTCYGTYINVIPYRKLRFSWRWKSEPGVESFVTVELTPENNRTHMRFEHAQVGTESQHNYREGWTSTFAKLKRVLR